KHRKAVRELVEKSPKSLWAPSAAYQTAMWEAKPGKSMDERVGYWQVIVEKYPTSPYAVEAQAQIAALWEEAPDSAKAMAAWKRLLELAPKGKYASSGWRYLALADQKEKNWESAQRNAQSWVQAAPVHEAFHAWMTLSEIQAARGDQAGAEQSRAAVKEAIDVFRRATRERTLTISEPKRVRVEAEVHALEAKLAGEDPKKSDAGATRQRGNFPGAFGGNTPVGGGRPGGRPGGGAGFGGGRPGGMMGGGFRGGMGRPGMGGGQPAGAPGAGVPGSTGPGASGTSPGGDTPQARP
ncbi:MAG: tetratricopeptide repeat protein, partial [Armatimonadaceae bacterium]